VAGTEEAPGIRYRVGRHVAQGQRVVRGTQGSGGGGSTAIPGLLRPRVVPSVAPDPSERVEGWLAVLREERVGY
jgi:hypothetical protein